MKNFNFTFSGASSFNFKEKLELTWSIMNRDWFPGDDMFSGTCSETVMCGNAATQTQRVAVSSVDLPRRQSAWSVLMHSLP